MKCSRHPGPRLAVALAVALAVCFPALAKAAVVTFRVSGAVTGVAEGAEFNVGDAVALEYAFEAATVDQDTNPGLGFYNSAVESVRVSIGSRSYFWNTLPNDSNSTPSPVGRNNFIRVSNDLPAVDINGDGLTRESYEMGSHGLPAADAFATVGLLLYSRYGSGTFNIPPFASDALPASPFPLAFDRTDGYFLLEDFSPNGIGRQSVGFSLDSLVFAGNLAVAPFFGDTWSPQGEMYPAGFFAQEVAVVPVPAAAWLFGSALGAVPFVRRGRRLGSR